MRATHRPHLPDAAMKEAMGVVPTTIVAIVTLRIREVTERRGAADIARKGGPQELSETALGKIIPTEKLIIWIQTCLHPQVDLLAMCPPPVAPSEDELVAEAQEAYQDSCSQEELTPYSPGRGG